MVHDLWSSVVLLISACRGSESNAVTFVKLARLLGFSSEDDVYSLLIVRLGHVI